MTQRHLPGPRGSWLWRAAGLVGGVLVLGVAIVLGAFVLAALLGMMLIVGAVLYARLWWLMRRGTGRGGHDAAQGPGTAGGQVIETEYEVIHRSEQHGDRPE